MKYNYKLLSKNTFVYLIITFIVFLITADAMSFFIEKYMSSELEERFRISQNRALHHFNKDDGDLQIYRNVAIKKLSERPDTNFFPAYQDTTFLRGDASEEEPHRIKKLVFARDNDYYEMHIIVGTSEFVLMRKIIINTLLPAFIILALLVVLINRFSSGILLRPFYKILDQIKTYSFGTKFEKVKTNTREFNDMQNLFQNMTERIEDDYKNLKEYTENMSHELQTPLSVIRRKIEHLVTDNRVMEHQSETIKQIYNEVNHLSSLGTALNLLTKIENQEFQNAQLLKTKNVIEQHAAKISELAELKSLKIKTDLSPEHELFIDPILFDIILTNLIRNALMYSSPDSEIEIKTTDVFTISNAGTPLDISPDKLFERFFSRGKNSKSLGLGLSIVKKICDLNNITIFYNFEKARHYFVLEQKPQ